MGHHRVDRVVGLVLRGGYFPGLYTAAGRLVLSVTVIYLLVKESRSWTTKRGQEAKAESPRPSALRARGASS